MQADHRRRKHPLVVSQQRGFVGAHGDDDVVTAREIVLQETKGLAKETLDAIALGRDADLASYSQPEARVAQFVGKTKDRERAAGILDPGGVNGVELARMLKTMLAGVGEGTRDGVHTEIVAEVGSGRVGTTGKAASGAALGQ